MNAVPLWRTNVNTKCEEFCKTIPNRDHLYKKLISYKGWMYCIISRLLITATHLHPPKSCWDTMKLCLVVVSHPKILFVIVSPQSSALWWNTYKQWDKSRFSEVIQSCNRITSEYQVWHIGCTFKIKLACSHSKPSRDVYIPQRLSSLTLESWDAWILLTAHNLDAQCNKKQTTHSVSITFQCPAVVSW